MLVNDSSLAREQAFAALQHFFRFGQKAAVQVIILNVRSILTADNRVIRANYRSRPRP
jgi:hypothetical protein